MFWVNLFKFCYLDSTASHKRLFLRLFRNFFWRLSETFVQINRMILIFNSFFQFDHFLAVRQSVVLLLFSFDFVVRLRVVGETSRDEARDALSAHVFHERRSDAATRQVADETSSVELVDT